MMKIYIYIIILFLILIFLVLVRFLNKNNDPFGDLEIPKKGKKN